MDYLFSAAEGLLDGRLDAEAFRHQLEVGYQPEPEPAKKANGKQATIVAMMRRPEGATVEQLAEATGWQRHSVRGLISAKLAKQHSITRTKAEKHTVYRIA
jgi:hypothetical protein